MTSPVFNYGHQPFADLLMANRVAYDGSGNAEYIGYAAPGTQENEAGWQICKMEYSSNVYQGRRWADGNNFQDKVWDSRTSYNYL